MRIAVIGAGNVETALAKRLKPQGHEVMLSYSRDLLATPSGPGPESGSGGLNRDFSGSAPAYRLPGPDVRGAPVEEGPPTVVVPPMQEPAPFMPEPPPFGNRDAGPPGTGSRRR